MPKLQLPANRRQGKIAQRLLAKTWQLPSLFSEAPCFCLYLLKVHGTVGNFKNPQRVFSNFCSFHPYHFKPNSNWCDSPFKLKFLGTREIPVFHVCPGIVRPPPVRVTTENIIYSKILLWTFGDLAVVNANLISGSKSCSLSKDTKKSVLKLTVESTEIINLF
jgi:hypothetical protein